MQYAILQSNSPPRPALLRFPQIVEDAADHLWGERALAGGVAQLLQFLGEVTVEGDPPLQFSPGGIGCKQGAVALCQFRAAVFFHCRFHTANILNISELRKFLWTEIHIIIIIYSDFD